MIMFLYTLAVMGIGTLIGFAWGRSSNRKERIR